MGVAVGMLVGAPVQDGCSLPKVGVIVGATEGVPVATHGTMSMYLVGVAVMPIAARISAFKAASETLFFTSIVILETDLEP